MSLHTTPIPLRVANHWVRELHRHRGPVTGALHCIGAFTEHGIVGCAILGRPTARHLDDGQTAEITRVATDGYPNACSLLYGACYRWAKHHGYRRVITYTGTDEPGTSLRASGFTEEHITRPSGGPRFDGKLKVRWSRISSPAQLRKGGNEP